MTDVFAFPSAHQVTDVSHLGSHHTATPHSLYVISSLYRHYIVSLRKSSFYLSSFAIFQVSEPYIKTAFTKV